MHMKTKLLKLITNQVWEKLFIKDEDLMNSDTPKDDLIRNNYGQSPEVS